MHRRFFVGIGAQRAGTTWLARYLSDHPQVGFSPIKELHYFDWRFCPEHCGGWHQEFSQRLAKVTERGGPDADSQAMFLRQRLAMADRPEAYLEFFDGLVEPEHRAFGEITPSYSMVPAAGFASMRHMLPSPRIIWILRNPAEKVQSQGFGRLCQFRHALQDADPVKGGPQVDVPFQRLGE